MGDAVITDAVNNFDFLKYKRVKTIQLINHNPDKIRLRVTVDKTSKIIVEGEILCQTKQ